VGEERRVREINPDRNREISVRALRRVFIACEKIQGQARKGKREKQEQKQIATEKAEPGLSNRILQTKISDHPPTQTLQITRLPGFPFGSDRIRIHRREERKPAQNDSNCLL